VKPIQESGRRKPSIIEALIFSLLFVLSIFGTATFGRTLLGLPEHGLPTGAVLAGANLIVVSIIETGFEYWLTNPHPIQHGLRIAIAVAVGTFVYWGFIAH
jgi:hypothetical protein